MHTKLDLFDLIKIRQYKNSGKVLSIKKLKSFFLGKDIFVFGNGGSLANLDGMSRLEEKNVVVTNRGIWYFYKLYGFMPNFWFIHTPEAIYQMLKIFENNGGVPNDFDLSNTFIFLPSNYSKSKAVQFSSKLFKEFRRSIKDNSVFVLYEEILKPSEYIDNQKYLTDEYPIIRKTGSLMEDTYLPFFNYIGINKFYFSGIDHLDSTGHFWDRNDMRSDADGKKHLYAVDESHDWLINNIEKVSKYVKQRNIKVFRLEKNETKLMAYPYIDFDQAIEKSIKKISPCDLKNYNSFKD